MLLRFALTLLLLFGLIGCSAKLDGFIGERDYPYPELPEGAVRQTPAYPVPPYDPAEADIVFERRPRPRTSTPN